MELTLGFLNVLLFCCFHSHSFAEQFILKRTEGKSCNKLKLIYFPMKIEVQILKPKQ